MGKAIGDFGNPSIPPRFAQNRVKNKPIERSSITKDSYSQATDIDRGTKSSLGSENRDPNVTSKTNKMGTKEASPESMVD